MTHLEFCAQALWPELDVLLRLLDRSMGADGHCRPEIARRSCRRSSTRTFPTRPSPSSAPARSRSSAARSTGRLFRISFSGELAYELAVPAGYGEAVADAIMEAGDEHGICPYGVEALGVMRIEKGHVTHAEINGTVMPGDLGFGRMVSATKPDFIGKAMLAREGLQPPTGLAWSASSRSIRPPASAPVRISWRTALPPSLENDQGYVTSSAFSPSLGSTRSASRWSSTGRSVIGEKVTVWNGLRNEFTEAVLCSPVFIDPENEKLHA